MFARFLVGSLITAALCLGQQKPDFAGDYGGVLGPLHIKLHVVAASDGSFTGTVDSPDQGLTGVPCADFQRTSPEFYCTDGPWHVDWIHER
jgi:hypothetical protein